MDSAGEERVRTRNTLPLTRYKCHTCFRQPRTIIRGGDVRLIVSCHVESRGAVLENVECVGRQASFEVSDL